MTTENKPQQNQDKLKETWKIIRDVDDPLALRLSVGSVKGKVGYIVYRGDTEECLELLRKAVRKLEARYKEQGE